MVQADFRMPIVHVSNYDVLERCTGDILSQIKPVEGDRNKRLYAIQELADAIYSTGALRGASVKPFGSFVSQLYAKSGDLDVSVELVNPLNLPTTKRKKQDTLREVRRALQRRGIARHTEFIPNARVPVLQYVSNQYGISCDISISNYSGQIKSKIFYWINTLDDRFGDMVLLVKEWAKAQNINDPKNGTLNSYSLCLLVLFHFQTCEPAILPPLKEIYEGNIVEDIAGLRGKPSKTQAAKYGPKKSELSLSHLLASFFQKFSRIGAVSNKVISTYTGRLERIQDNPRWMDKSYSLFVEDPFEKPDNAARAVGSFEFQDIVNAFSNASNKFLSDAHALTDRNELLSLLCTPDVGSKLGGRARASRYTNILVSPHDRFIGYLEYVAPNPYDDQHHQPARGGSRSGQSPHGYTTNRQTAVHYQNNNHPQAYNTQRQTTVHHQNQNHQQAYAAGRQTGGQYQNTQRSKENTSYRHSNGRAATIWHEPVRGRFCNGEWQ
uniref:Poly(A) RNA polymerase mitochondrial-like central palm domain-containing protein n=1 Tax=Oryza punctata TaxID=4537 RepID=A0A0E0JQY8_ORYPU